MQFPHSKYSISCRGEKLWCSALSCLLSWWFTGQTFSSYKITCALWEKNKQENTTHWHRSHVQRGHILIFQGTALRCGYWPKDMFRFLLLGLFKHTYSVKPKGKAAWPEQTVPSSSSPSSPFLCRCTLILSCCRSTLSPFKTAAVQPDRVSLKAPIEKYSCICLWGTIAASL